ncbi:MAG: type III polyketide synthase [Parachlamydiaceae bacterium]|nr:type III polyketide synthase [Parachlamydiaceae bacterium]
MTASILALATAVPPHAFDQSEIAEKIIDIFNINPEKADSIKQLYKNSAIQTRYSVISDFKKERPEWNFWGSQYPKTIPTTSQRNEVFKIEASKLAYEAASKVLKAWGGNTADISHIISVSCTGMVAPGIEFDLMQLLNLKPSIQRLGINFMGCFGAFKGLSVAQAFAKENPKHRILLVCTELCSLHFQAELTFDNILGNSLFSDGAAAVIVGGDHNSHETPIWEICNKGSLAIDNTIDKMKWEIGDHGFNMRLSHTVPVLLGRHIAPFVQSLMGKDCTYDNCDWAIHPGGKSIIQAIEKALKLQEGLTKSSWDTLANYGNMSSATFLFVLQRLLEQKSSKKWTIGIGFGPGLSVEGILLSRPPV